ncbi:uncharacterized protein [Dysidea avara]
MMMRVCVLPRGRTDGAVTRDTTASGWFLDRHMQELLMMIYDELSRKSKVKPSASDKVSSPLFKRGSGFRAAVYFDRHGYFQHLVIPPETKGKTKHNDTGHSFKLHPEAVYTVVDDLELPSNKGVAKLVTGKGKTKDITSYFTLPPPAVDEDKENVLPTLPVINCKQKNPLQTRRKQAVKPQPQVTPSHQLRIDTLLSRNETHTHIITTTPSDNLKTDILADSPTSVASESDVKSCCGQVSYSDDISDDVIDCLFDDIDYLDKFFEPEPLPLATESHHCSVPVKVNSDQTETDIAPIVVSHDDDDDVIDLSSISSSSDSTISGDDVVIKEKKGKSYELSRRTIFKDTCTVKELTTKQIGRWMVFRKNFIRDIMAGKIPCERHNRYKEGNNARRIIRNESFMITAFSREQLDYIIDHLKKLFELDGLLNYDYVMSVLLIEVCIHIIMDLHQVDYHTAEKTLMTLSF